MTFTGKMSHQLTLFTIELFKGFQFIHIKNGNPLVNEVLNYQISLTKQMEESI